MRTIASLLFGREAGELLDLITGEGGITGERASAGRAAATTGGRGRSGSGEWCGSTPGRGSAHHIAGPAPRRPPRIVIGDGPI